MLGFSKWASLFVTTTTTTIILLGLIYDLFVYVVVTILYYI